MGIYDQPGSACLKTRVRNISGGKMAFAYLPPFGKTLDANEEYEFEGNLVDFLAHRRDGGHSEFDSLVKDLTDGRLAILYTPSPHYYDPQGNTVQILKIVGGDLVFDDPCWGHFVASS